MTFGSHAARNASRQLRPRGSRRREFRPNSVPVPRKGQVFRSFTSPPVSERRPRKRSREALRHSPACLSLRRGRPGLRVACGDGTPSRGPARGPRAGRLTRLSPSREPCTALGPAGCLGWRRALEACVRVPCAVEGRRRSGLELAPRGLIPGSQLRSQGEPSGEQKRGGAA